MSKTLIIILFLSLNGSSILYSQIFDWGRDCFKYNETLYSNVDNSGIDIEILGMEYGSSYNGNWLFIGINNNVNSGYQHHYEIRFSETVSLEFMIQNINRDTAGYLCYNDQLILHGNYSILLSSSNLTFSGDTVFAPWGSNPNDAGFIKLRYENIDTLIIQHGEGSGCNPGYLYISPLTINDIVVPNGYTNCESNSAIMTGPNSIVLENLTAALKNIGVFNSLGQSVNFSIQTSTELMIELQNVSAGIYVISVELEDGEFIQKKILIQE